MYWMSSLLLATQIDQVFRKVDNFSNMPYAWWNYKLQDRARRLHRYQIILSAGRTVHGSFYLNSIQLLTLYTSQVRPTVDFGGLLWSKAPKFLNKIPLSLCLLYPLFLINGLQFEHRRQVGMLSLFCRYFNGSLRGTNFFVPVVTGA